MSKSKYLFKNTALFSISTVATKLISILMVPLYTYVFTTEQFGLIEVIMTSINLISPILILSINDAVLRFSLSKEVDRSLIFSYGLFIGLIGTILTFLVIPFLKQIGGVGNYAYAIIILLSLMSIYKILSYFAMGIERTRSFVISNMFIAVAFAIFNYIFLVVFKFEVNGYLLSFILSNAIAFFILFYAVNGKSYLTLKIFRKENYGHLSNMLTYSFPLITNSLMWWVTNASDRYIVYYLLGSSITGIYAVANKLPVILSSTIGIFNQAWQLSAIKEYDSIEKNEYYTIVYVRLFSAVLVISSLLIAFIKIILEIFVSKDYYIAWQCAPLLILAAGLSVIASFLGANYIAAKENKGNMLSTFAGAAINVSLNFILIPIYNLQGAAFSTFVSYALVVAYRLVDTRKYVLIKWANMNIFMSFALVLTQIVMLNIDLAATDILNYVIACIILVINKYLITDVLKLVRHKIIRTSSVSH